MRYPVLLAAASLLAGAAHAAAPANVARCIDSPSSGPQRVEVRNQNGCREAFDAKYLDPAKRVSVW